jgi:integrase
MSEQILAYPSRSVWGEHSTLKRKLERHSVEKDVKSFCGWGKLNEIVDVTKGIGFNGDRNSGFVATLFCTGGRVSEVLALKPKMFSVFKGCVPKLILVSGMPLLKRYKKLSDFLDDKGHKHYKTEKINATRDFSFRVDEPLVKPMVGWIIYALDNRLEWLFPSPYKTGEPLSRKWAYRLIEKIGVKANMEIWPHWFRSQRACCLASEYEFKEGSILEWFQWESWMTAKQYTKLGPLGLAKKMGVKFRKDRELKLSEIENLKVE